MYFVGGFDGGIIVVLRRQGHHYFCVRVVAQRKFDKKEKRSLKCTKVQFLKEFARANPIQRLVGSSQPDLGQFAGANPPRERFTRANYLSGLGLCLELECDVLILGEVCLEPQCNGEKELM